MRKLQIHELERMDAAKFREASKIPVWVILDRVRSLHNVGSVFRTSDAFRIEHIALCGLTATPPHPEIEKTALGATEAVDWSSFDDASEAILRAREKGYAVFAVEQATGSISPEDFQTAHLNGVALIFGHEVTGVREDLIPLCDGAIEIPQSGTKHSLNVSVSAGLILWELFKKLRNRL